jgi:molybdopterin-binding protein
MANISRIVPKLNAIPLADSNININFKRLTNLAAPTTANDAVRKADLDTVQSSITANVSNLRVLTANTTLTLEDKYLIVDSTLTLTLPANPIKGLVYNVIRRAVNSVVTIKEGAVTVIEASNTTSINRVELIYDGLEWIAWVL